MGKNIFADFEKSVYQHQWNGTLEFNDRALGGTPADAKTAESWIRAKVTDATSEDEIQKMLAQTMVDNKVPLDDAISSVADIKTLKVIMSDEIGLYFSARILKAALKESASVAQGGRQLVKSEKIGANNAGLRSWLPEHLFVEEQKLYLKRDGVILTEPDGVQTRFCHTFRGDSIVNEQYVDNAEIDFTIISDWDQWPANFWPILWVIAGKQGLGSTRSQGYGTYKIIKWDKVPRG
jgi:hypothetical protein